MILETSVGRGSVCGYGGCRARRNEAEWLFHSNELQRSHVPARKLCLRAFEPARRMRRKPPVLTRQNPEPCNLPRSAPTQWVKERNC